MVELEQHWQHQARRATFEDYRRRNVTTWIAPYGGSMRPLIGPATWMLVEFGAADVSIGDVVLFPLGNVLVAHRVVAWGGRPGAPQLTTKGDAEPFYDAPVPLASVIGVARALRQGRDGPSTRFGCTGRSARGIARVSRLHGRAAWLARRAAELLPDPLRRPILRVVPPLARVAARILLSPLPWAASYRTQIT